MYASYFGLSEPPFNITPDPRFLYVNECYQEAIAALRYGIDARKGFIALVGEAGTGKTTMLRRLMDALDPSCRTVLLLHPTVSFDEILEHILLELGIPVEGARKLTMLQRLHEFLIEHTHAGGNVALLIDESQDLQTSVLEELRLLSNLETGKEKIIQIVLAGQPELDGKFADVSLRQLRQRITLQIRLRQLRADEVAAYIAARLERVGGQLDRVFEPAAVARIAAVSAGIPRVVNVVCDASMLHAFATESGRVTATIVDEAWADYSRGYQAMEGAPLVPAQAVRADTAVTPAPVTITEAPAPVTAPLPEPKPSAAASVPEMPVSSPVEAIATEAAAALDGPAIESSVPEASTPEHSIPDEPAPAPMAPGVTSGIGAAVVAHETATEAATEPEPAPLPDSIVTPAIALEPPPSSGGMPWRLVLSGAIVAAVGITLVSLSQRPPAVAVPQPTPTVTVPSTLPPATAPPTTVPPATAPPTQPPTTLQTTLLDPPPTTTLPPVATAEPLTPADARALVESFRTAYESRDVTALGALLAPDVVHNEARGRTKVLGDYQAAFADIDQIQYHLPNLQVALRGQGTIVTSPFVISYRQGGGKRQELRGTAEWRVERRDGRPVIAALMYHFDS